MRTHRATGLRFKRGLNLAGNQRVWIDLHGNSYAGTDDPQALADWLDAIAVPWLRKQKLRKDAP